MATYTETKCRVLDDRVFISEFETTKTKVDEYQTFFENMTQCSICHNTLKPYILSCDECQNKFCSICILNPYLQMEKKYNETYPNLYSSPLLNITGDGIIVNKNVWDKKKMACPLCRKELGPEFKRDKNMERTVESYKSMIEKHKCIESSVYNHYTPSSTPISSSSFSSPLSSPRSSTTDEDGSCSHPFLDKIVCCDARDIGCTWSGEMRLFTAHQKTGCRYRSMFDYMKQLKHQEIVINERRDKVQQSIPLVKNLINRFEKVYSNIHRYANCHSFVFQFLYGIDKNNTAFINLSDVESVESENTKRDSSIHSYTNLKLYQYPLKMKLILNEEYKKFYNDSDEKDISNIKYYDLLLSMDTPDYSFTTNEIVRVHVYTYLMGNQKSGFKTPGGNMYQDQLYLYQKTMC